MTLNVPNPESNYSSELANTKNNSNWSGISDKRIDGLIAKYNLKFEKNKGIDIIRQIDD